MKTKICSACKASFVPNGSLVGLQMCDECKEKIRKLIDDDE